MVKEKFNKSLSKKAKKGFRGYPIATIAHYGPNDKKATKVVASIVAYEGAEPEPMKKWFSENDVRNDKDIKKEILEFLSGNKVTSVVMPDRIIGCPHEEGIDYPDGEDCPLCSFWKGKDRWSGESIH